MCDIGYEVDYVVVDDGDCFYLCFFFGMGCVVVCVWLVVVCDR